MNEKHTPQPRHIEGDFFAVEQTNWVSVNRKGEILLADGTITPGQPPTEYWPYYTHGRQSVHRISALTFIECPGNPEHYHVNHKDGVKENNATDNLEWTLPSENATHAYATGLREDNRLVWVKNLETGEVQDFYSLQACARHFKVNASIIRNHLKGDKKYPWRRKWTFKYDGEPWSSLSRNDVGKVNGVSRDIISVDEQTGRKIIYPGISAAARVRNINPATLSWYLRRLGVGKTNLYNGEHWYYLDEYQGSLKDVDRMGNVIKAKTKLPKRKPFRVKVTDLKSGEVTEWESLQHIADAVGKKKNSLEKAMWRNKGVVENSRYEYVS